jgi:hypothetical protein
VSYAKGRTRQVYVSKDLLPLAERWVRNYHQGLTVLEEISSINLELIRSEKPFPTEQRARVTQKYFRGAQPYLLSRRYGVTGVTALRKGLVHSRNTAYNRCISVRAFIYLNA